MPDHDYAPPEREPAQSVEAPAITVADLGSNADQCALAEGCDKDVPPVDDLFWEGFADEYAALQADIVAVTTRAMTLQAEIPSVDHQALLDYHLEGVFGLEEDLCTAVATAQAGSAYAEGDEVDVDDASVDAALDVWDRMEVALDILREHNGLYAATLAQDLAAKYEQLATLAGVVVESGVDRSMREAGQRTQAALEAFTDSWTIAAASLAKIPADIAVDLAVGAAITAAVPTILGAAGLTGTLPAVVVALAIAGTASLAWNAVTDPWGPDVSGLEDNVNSANGWVDIGSDSAAIDHAGAEFKATAERTGNVSLWLTVVLDMTAAGHAIAGAYEASAAWEAFKVEHAKLEQLWTDAVVLLGGFVRFAEQMKSGAAMLGAEISRRRGAIDALEAVYGPALYA